MSTCQRHLTTAGVCDSHLGGSLRHLPTAGVCDPHLGIFLRYFLIAGICLQENGRDIGLQKVHAIIVYVFTHCPTAIVCNRHVSVFLRHTLLVEGKKTNLFEGYPSRRLRNNAAKQLTLPKAYLGQVLGGCSCVHHTPCTCTQVSIT